MSLFRRSGKRMVLTDEGRRLLERVCTAIGEITEGVEAIRSGKRDRSLTISMVPGVRCILVAAAPPATSVERHPDIEVNIRPTMSLTDFTRDEVDMAVRFGPGAWPGSKPSLTLQRGAGSVCSPAFRGGRLPRAPGDLLKMPLLHDERQPWSIWFEAVGLDYRDAGQRPRYADQTLLVAAAIAGLGVAFGACIAGPARAGIRPAGSALFPERAHALFILHRISGGFGERRKNPSVSRVAAGAGRSGERNGAIGARAGKGVATRALRLVRR